MWVWRGVFGGEGIIVFNIVRIGLFGWGLGGGVGMGNVLKLMMDVVRDLSWFFVGLGELDVIKFVWVVWWDGDDCFFDLGLLLYKFCICFRINLAIVR